MEERNDISTSTVITKSGFEVAEGLKFRFGVEAKKRRLKSREALAQALELWLATTTRGEVNTQPSEITSDREEKTTPIELTHIVNLLTQLSASLQNQTEEIRALKLVISQKAERRGGNTSNKPTITPTKRERAAASVLKRNAGDK